MTRLIFIAFFITLTLQAQSTANQNNLRFNMAAGCNPVVQPMGSFDVTLTPSVTPMTVANFLGYVNSGGYNCTIIHRSTNTTNSVALPPFIIQGGGYVLNGVLPVLAPQMAPITNEFKASNTAGTIAMALTGSSAGSNPDSATNQWFINTADNSSSIDGGKYTVFGNVANSSGMTIVNNINQLPTYSVNYGQEASFADLPLYNLACSSGQCARAQQGNFIFVTSINTIGPPQVTAAGVADAATAQNNSSTGISPGEFITFYGSNFGTSTPSYLGPGLVAGLTLNSAGTAALTNLQGTQVTFNGQVAPIVFTLDSQIGVIAPYSIANLSTVSVSVSYLGGFSKTMTFNVVPTTPGLFTLSQTGLGDAAIRRVSDASVVSSSSPAAVGETLELFGEGYGAATINSALPDGAVVGGALPKPTLPITLLIDKQPVGSSCQTGNPCSYAGAAGGAVNGVLQVNFVVPQLAPGSHQIQIQVGTAISPLGVTLQTK